MSTYFQQLDFPATSCEVERLFSVAKNVNRYNRKSMLPVRQLKVNLFWDALL
jgi:hypothetical protein